MTPPHRRRQGFAPPYYLRPHTLIVFHGAPRSGKTTQLDRLRQVGARAELFAAAPQVVDLALAPATTRQTLVHAALDRLDAGGVVLAEGWDYSVRTPDLVLLFPHSVDGSNEGWAWPPVDAGRGVPMPEGHEGQVGIALWTALAARRFYSPCSCIADAA